MDNFICQDCSAEKVDACIATVRRAFEVAGLALHPVDWAADRYRCLGMEQKGKPPKVDISATRYWKLKLALEHVLWKGEATALSMEKLIGHWTFACLLRRPLLCVLRAAYDFLRAEDDSCAASAPQGAVGAAHDEGFDGLHVGGRGGAYLADCGRLRRL